MSTLSGIKKIFSNSALAKNLLGTALEAAKPELDAIIKAKLGAAGLTVDDTVIAAILNESAAAVMAKIE